VTSPCWQNFANIVGCRRHIGDMSPTCATKAAAAEKGNKKKKGQKNKNKKDKIIVSNRKRTKPGRKFRQRMGKSMKRSMTNVPTTGANTTWHGPCICPKSVALARNEWEKKHQVLPSPPLPLPRSTSPPWQSFKTRNGSASQHGS
jgi:hypothetical protein